MKSSDVSRRKFPALYRALKRWEQLVEKQREGWARVVELRKRGGGDRLARKLMGVKSKPMPEKVKAMLRNRRRA